MSIRLLALSQDKNVLEPSSVQERISSFGGIVDELTIVLFGIGAPQKIQLRHNVAVVSAGGGNKLSALFFGILLLLSEARKGTYSLITTQNPFWMGIVALAIARFHRIPLQVQVHTDCFSKAYRSESVWRAIEAHLARVTLRGASCVRAVSSRVAESVSRVTNLPVAIVPVRTSPVASARIPRGPRQVFSFLTVSRLTPEKQVHVLIEAVAKVPEAELTIVGEGPLRGRLENLARDLGISARVHFIGWEKNVDAYYARADAYVQASRYEGYGLSLIEAALHALPIITTDVGIVGEVLAPDTDAFVVEGSPSAFAKAMELIVKDSDRARLLGENASRKAHAHALSEEDYLKEYKKALSVCPVRKFNDA